MLNRGYWRKIGKDAQVPGFETTIQDAANHCVISGVDILRRLLSVDYFCRMDYTVPAGTKIGHIHLKVADIPRALSFYQGLLGFEITERYGDSAVFISAGGYHHHIGLNTWQSKGAPPAPARAAGLFHTAILYPTRKDLAIVFNRLRQAGYPFTGYADHGVSEALYLNDPDNNGVELYWDRPRELWPRKSDGSLNMGSEALDLPGLLAELPAM